MRFSVEGRTDQSASQVDTCRPRIGAIDPLGFWETEKPGACHGVVLDKVGVVGISFPDLSDMYAFHNIR